MSAMSISEGLPGFLHLSEAAEIIGVSHAQVTRYIANNLLDAVVIGREYLVKETDVRNFQRPPRGNPAFQPKPRKKTR